MANMLVLALACGSRPTQADPTPTDIVVVKHAGVPAYQELTEEFAEAAMAHGANPDRAVADGRPLLNDLIRWGQFRQALWLLGRGASPNIADEKGWTAMHQAASRGNAKMMRALIDAGGDLSRRDAQGNLPRDVATKEIL